MPAGHILARTQVHCLLRLYLATFHPSFFRPLGSAIDASDVDAVCGLRFARCPGTGSWRQSTCRRSANTCARLRIGTSALSSDVAKAFIHGRSAKIIKRAEAIASEVRYIARRHEWKPVSCGHGAITPGTCFGGRKRWPAWRAIWRVRWIRCVKEDIGPVRFQKAMA